MRRYWFSSDFHFNHSNIIKYSNRPFASVGEMNEKIIQNINKVVGREDYFYFLGDFAFTKDLEQFVSLRQRINCYNMFCVLGNHDKLIRRYQRELEESSFNWIEDYQEIEIESIKVVLCHYAMKVWNKCHYGSYHLYGHSHGSLPDDPNMRSIDVGVDTCLFGHERFTPYSWEEIKTIMSQKEFKPKDHHRSR